MPNLTEIFRVGFKLFLANPLPLEEIVPVFHKWIQGKQIPDHQLIDVSDYRHVVDGPGVLLITHQANFGLDAIAGHAGLAYTRKQRGAGDFERQIGGALRVILSAALLLELDPELQGRAIFRTDRLFFHINDRLNAPASPETFAAVEAALNVVFKPLGPPCFERQSDPARPFTISVHLPETLPVRQMLARLG